MIPRFTILYRILYWYLLGVTLRGCGTHGERDAGNVCTDYVLSGNLPIVFFTWMFDLWGYSLYCTVCESYGYIGGGGGGCCRKGISTRS